MADNVNHDLVRRLRVTLELAEQGKIMSAVVVGIGPTTLHNSNSLADINHVPILKFEVDAIFGHLTGELLARRAQMSKSLLVPGGVHTQGKMNG